jgi:proline iminopeptidase
MRKFLVILGVIAAIPVLFYAVTIFMPITFIQTVDENAELPSITLNGYKFHAETMGEDGKPVIIVMHGGPGGDYRNLLPIAPLARDYHLVFYDQRMTGLSSRKFEGTITLKSFFDDLDAFVDHYGKGAKVILLGHSWGAMMASGYIGMHPAKVDKIVMIEPGILRPDLSQEFLDSQSGPKMDAYFDLALVWLNSQRVDVSRDAYAREDYLLSNAYKFIGGENVHCGDVIPANFEGWRASRKVLNETVIASANDPVLFAQLDFITDAHKFDGEVLLIGSTCNTVYGAEYQKRHLPFYKHATLAIIEDAGHFIFYDQPDASLDVIREFLERK